MNDLPNSRPRPGRLATTNGALWGKILTATIALLVTIACSDSTELTPQDAGSDASTGETVESVQIPVGDFVFDARRAGPRDGELVLLLHGFPETSYEWRNQFAPFAAAGFNVVAPDQRGYSPGARPPAIDGYNVLALAQDAIGMASALGANRYHLVGHDWGATLAWVIGLLDARRVISITTMSVPHPDAFQKQLADPSSCQAAASQYFDTFIQPDAEDSFLAGDAGVLRGIYNGIDQEAVDEYLRVLGSKRRSAPRSTGTAPMWWIPRTDAGAELGPIALPTMFVWSDGDTAICREGAEDTGNYVTGPYRFEALTGVDHWIADKASARLTPLLLDHIGQYREAK